MFSHMAKGLNAHGVDVAVVGYDLCPQVSIADIIEQMRAACLYLWRQHGKRIIVYGHSAGGHLTACMVATDWKALAARRAGRSGAGRLCDFRRVRSGAADASVAERRPAPDRRDRARRLAALLAVPAGRTLDAVVGGIESSEFLRQSKIIVDAWRGQGADALRAKSPAPIISP